MHLLKIRDSISQIPHLKISFNWFIKLSPLQNLASINITADAVRRREKHQIKGKHINKRLKKKGKERRLQNNEREREKERGEQEKDALNVYLEAFQGMLRMVRAFQEGNCLNAELLWTKLKKEDDRRGVCVGGTGEGGGGLQRVGGRKSCKSLRKLWTRRIRLKGKLQNYPFVFVLLEITRCFDRGFLVQTTCLLLLGYFSDVGERDGVPPNPPRKILLFLSLLPSRISSGRTKTVHWIWSPDVRRHDKNKLVRFLNFQLQLFAISIIDLLIMLSLRSNRCDPHSPHHLNT